MFKKNFGTVIAIPFKYCFEMEQMMRYVMLILLSAVIAVPAYADNLPAAKQMRSGFFPLAPYTKEAKTPIVRNTPSKLKLATARGSKKMAEKQRPQQYGENDQQLLSIFAQ